MDYELDVVGLKCPMPLLKAKNRLTALQPGDTLHVKSTDAQSEEDFLRFCDGNFCTVVSVERKSGGIILSLRREVLS